MSRLFCPFVCQHFVFKLYSTSAFQAWLLFMFSETTRHILSNKATSYQYDNAQQYIMNIGFTDGLANTDTGYFLLYVTRNNPPLITNLNRK